MSVLEMLVEHLVANEAELFERVRETESSNRELSARNMKLELRLRTAERHRDSYRMMAQGAIHLLHAVRPPEWYIDLYGAGARRKE
jgi:hypothetical protein